MSPGAAIAVAAAGCVVVAGAIVAMMIWLRRSNAASEQAALSRLQEELAQRGWTFAERDDSVVSVYNAQNQYTQRNPFDPLTRPPTASAARDVITGTHRGRPFLAASFTVAYRGEHEPLRCIWVRTPAVRPALSVTRVLPGQNPVDQALGQGGVRTGDPEFDRRFRVAAEDDRFALAVLTPQLIQFLLHDPRPFKGFWLLGEQFDVLDPVRDHRDPAELIPALDLRCDVLDLIPPSVWA